MKIIRYDEDVLQLRPTTGIILALVGLLLMLGGIVAFFFLGQTSTLVCERFLAGRASCTLQKTLLGLTLSEKPIEALRGARVEAYEDSEGDETYKVILMTARGEIPFAGYSSSGYNQKERIAGEVNDFVRDATRPTLHISQSGGVGTILVVVFGVFGLVMGIGGLRSYFTTWTFDRTSGLLTRRRERLTGVRIEEYPLRDIVNVRLDESTDSDGTTYRIEIDISGGNTLPMTSWYSSGRAGKEKAIALIREFLNLKTKPS